MGLRETLQPQFDGREWQLAFTALEGSPGQETVIYEYLPQGQSIDDWIELVTVTTLFGVANASLDIYLGGVMEYHQNELIGGTIDFDRLQRLDDEIYYHWTVKEDLLLPGQYEVVRIYRRGSNIHNIRYCTRTGMDDRQNQEQWLERLKRAELIQSDFSSWREIPLDKKKIETVSNAFALLKDNIHGLKTREKVNQCYTICRRALSALKSHQFPVEYAFLNLFLGNLLHHDSPEDFQGDAIMAAISAYRKAARSYRLMAGESNRLLWAECVAKLADAFLLGGQGSLKQKAATALHGCEKALSILGRKNSPKAWAFAWHTRAKVCLNIKNDKDGESRKLALQACKYALEVFTPADDIVNYLEVKITMGHIFRLFFGDVMSEYFTLATGVYREVVNTVREVVNTSVEDKVLETLPSSVLAAGVYREMVNTFREVVNTFVEDKVPEIVPGVIEAAESVVEDYLSAIKFLSPEESPMDWAFANYSLANAMTVLGPDDRGDHLKFALKGIENALTIYTMEAHPWTWIHSMMTLGEVYRELGEKTNEEYLKLSLDAYLQVEQAFMSDTVLNTKLRWVERETEKPTEESAKYFSLLAKVQHRIQNIQSETEMYKYKPVFIGEKEKRFRANILYLRPFEAGRIVLENKFREPQRLRVRYDEEPPEFTFEACLNRVLAPYIELISFGGTLAPYCSARTNIIGDWRNTVLNHLQSQPETGSPIIVCPSVNPGTRWEMEQLNRLNLFPFCVFVMPPDSRAYDVAGLWRQAAAMMGELGVRLPPYEKNGLFFRVDSSGEVRERWHFDCVWEGTLIYYFEDAIPLPMDHEESMTVTLGKTPSPPPWWHWMDVMDCSQYPESVIHHNVVAGKMAGFSHRHARCKYLGVYLNGPDELVKYVAGIEAVVDVKSPSSMTLKWNNTDKPDPDVLETAMARLGHLRPIEYPVRLFLLSELFPTQFTTDSIRDAPGGRRYIDVRSLEPFNAKDLAEKLTGRDWSEFETWPFREN